MLGRYKILEELGAGGMGEVYLAEDTQLGRKVALKALPTPYTGDTERARRFQQEARAASGLNHPNILTIHEVGEAGGRPFIATEYVEGETLREALVKSPRMSLSKALDVVVQMASALATAHTAGIIHRDIKPENIMLRMAGLVKVLDFGLAKLTEPEDMTLEASTLMLTGRQPFAGMTPSDVLACILTKEPVPLSSYGLEIPAELEWITSKALNKDREECYQTVKDLSSDLRRLKQRLEFETQMERSASQQFSDVEKWGVSGSAQVSAARRRAGRGPHLAGRHQNVLRVGLAGCRKRFQTRPQAQRPISQSPPLVYPAHACRPVRS
jgi:predicted Ser/Thr protein kinase